MSVIAQVPFVGPEVQWFALSPLLVLVGAAILLLLAGALTPTWPRGLYAGVTAAAAIAAGVLAVIQWDDISDSSTSTLVGGAIAFDTFAMFVTIVICAAVVGVALVAGDQLHRDGGDGPEVYALVLVAAAGAVVMGAANDLIVLFLGLETMSLAFYVLGGEQPAAHEEPGERDEVLHPRRVLVGVLPLRHRPRLRLDRLDEPVGDRHGVRQHDPRRPQRRPAARRHRPAARRARLQGRRRSVPRVDARRLRGSPDADHRADGVGRQGGGVRRDAARARRRLRPLPRRLAAGRLGPRRGVAGDRTGARHRADRRQADARLLVDQPRRVHARRPGGRGTQRRRGRQRSRRALRDGLHAGLRRARRRHVRRRLARRPARRHAHRSRLVPRSRPAPRRARPWPSPCSSSPRPACRSRAGSSPSSG